MVPRLRRHGSAGGAGGRFRVSGCIDGSSAAFGRADRWVFSNRPGQVRRPRVRGLLVHARIAGNARGIPDSSFRVCARLRRHGLVGKSVPGARKLIAMCASCADRPLIPSVPRRCPWARERQPGAAGRACGRLAKQLMVCYAQGWMRSFNRGGCVVRTLPLALFLGLLLCHPLPAPLNVSFIGRAAAESRDDLYKKCRAAVFRQYGQPGIQYNRRPGSRVLPNKFLIGAVDQCVANGGPAR